MTVNRLD